MLERQHIIGLRLGDRSAADDGALAAAALVESEAQKDPSMYASSPNLRMNVNPMGPATAAVSLYRDSTPSTSTSTNLSLEKPTQKKSQGIMSFSMGDLHKRARTTHGVMVLTLKPDCEAATVGVRPGDRIHRINGELVPLDVGHRLVAERLRRASRPMVLTLEVSNVVSGWLKLLAR